MIIVGSFLPEPFWLVKRYQVYSGVTGAGVVMESIALKIPGQGQEKPGNSAKVNIGYHLH